MSDKGKPSEFGGKVTSKIGRGIQPSPHVPTPSERLSALYRSGDESGLTPPDNGEVFSGLMGYEKMLAIRTAEGVMEKGQVWEAMEVAGDAALDQLRTKEPNQ